MAGIGAALALVVAHHACAMLQLGIYKWSVLGALWGAIYLARSRALAFPALILTLVEAFWLVLPEGVLVLPVLPALVPWVLALGAMLLAREGGRAEAGLVLGKLDAEVIAWTLAIGVGSGAALLAWASWTERLGAGQGMVAPFAGSSVPVLVAGVGIFALANAFAEEVIYRGAFQEGLTRVLQRGGESRGNDRFALLAAWVLQASAFASLHFQAGFPNGWPGYAMLLVFGTLLGWLRHRSRGLLAPIFAHVGAILVVAGYLIYSVRDWL